MASTSSGSSMPVSVVPAAVQLDASPREASPKPITWLPESPMNTAAGRPGRRLNGRKARQAAPRASASGEHDVALARSARRVRPRSTAQATAASVAASPSMLSSRLKAFVIPTSQTSPSTVASTFDCRRSRPTARSRARSPRRRTGLRASATGGASGGRPRGPRGRGACSRRGFPSSSEDALDRTDGDREQRRPATKPAKMPTPPKSRGRALVPALPASARRRAARRAWDRKQRPDDEGRDGQGRERDDRAHERKA